MTFPEEFNLLKDDNESFTDWFDNRLKDYNNDLKKYQQKISYLPDASVLVYSLEDKDNLFQVKSFLDVERHLSFMSMFTQGEI